MNFVLTTKLFCGKCGSMMAGESGTSKSGAKYYYYKCSKAKNKRKGCCDLKPIRKDAIERFVVRIAAERVLREDTIDRLVKLVLEYINKENTMLPVLQKELAGVEKKLSNLINLVEEGLLTDTIRQRLTELESRKKELYKPPSWRNKLQNRPLEKWRFVPGSTASAMVIWMTSTTGSGSWTPLSTRFTSLMTG